MVNVLNSKTRTLQNKDSALQRNVQHKLVWRIRFAPAAGVAKSVRSFDATNHDVTIIKLDSRRHYDYVLRPQLVFFILAVSALPISSKRGLQYSRCGRTYAL